MAMGSLKIAMVSLKSARMGDTMIYPMDLFGCTPFGFDTGFSFKRPSEKESSEESLWNQGPESAHKKGPTNHSFLSFSRPSPLSWVLSLKLVKMELGKQCTCHAPHLSDQARAAGCW